MAKIITNGDKSGHIDGTGKGDLIYGYGGEDHIGGHGGNDTIYGGNDDDHLHGGSGHDLLYGEGGKDLFVFKEFGAGDSDELFDFKHKTDSIGIDGVYLKAFKSGKFTADEFYLGAKAHDGNDYLIYDKASGHLYYDDDGNGAHKQHLLATLDGHPNLTTADISVFLEV